MEIKDKVKPAIEKLTGEYWWRKATTFAGHDVGKRGNPSHCSVFAIMDDPERKDSSGNPLDLVVQIHQKFLDGWDYTKQVDYLTALVDFFNIQKLYYDATRGELEERSLPRSCIPIILSNRTGPRAKGKMELATNFAKLVEQKRIKLLDDDRFISQITCVTSDLQAPDTPRGHGDSFISIILAIGVYYDYYAPDRKMGSTTICNVQDLVSYSEKGNLTNNILGRKGSTEKCKICGGIQFEETPDKTKKVCKKCFTMW